MRLELVALNELTPLKILMQMRPLRPQNATLAKTCSKAYHTVYRPLRSLHVLFARLTLLPSPNLLCFTVTMFFNQPDTHKSALPVRASTPIHAIHVAWTHRTLHPKLHLDRFSRFCTAHRRVSVLYNVRQDMINACLKK